MGLVTVPQDFKGPFTQQQRGDVIRGFLIYDATEQILSFIISKAKATTISKKCLALLFHKDPLFKQGHTLAM